MCRRLLPLLLLALGVAACDSSPNEPPPPIPSIDGSWAGFLVSAGDTLAVTMTLVEEGGFVNGAGTAERPADVLGFDVEGIYAHPNLSLSLIFDRPPLGSLSGVVSAGRDRITGTLSGPNIAGPVELDLAPRPAL